MKGLLQGIEPDHAYYSDEYRGPLESAEFYSALPDAIAEVSAAVWPGADLAAIEDRVKMAVCAVVDAIGNVESRVTSYKAGDVSQSYGSAGFSLTSEAAIRRWLGGTGSLKRGRWL